MDISVVIIRIYKYKINANIKIKMHIFSCILRQKAKIFDLDNEWRQSNLISAKTQSNSLTIFVNEYSMIS